VSARFPAPRSSPDPLRLIRDSSAPQALFLSLAILTVPFALLGFTRGIDGDEGYYLLAAKLVGETQTLYSDFLYTQMPLLPYAYSLWLTVVGISWLSARAFSIALAIALGVLLFYSLLKARHSPNLALLGVILYSSSSLALGWFTVVKTYALSTFFLLSAYVVLYHVPRLSPRYSWLLSGFLFGCAVNTRLFLAAVLPAFLASLYARTGNASTVRFVLSSGWYIGGIVIALLPDLSFLFKSPSSFLFGNLDYHFMRSDMTLREALWQKVEVAVSVVGINTTTDGVGVFFQFKVLLLFNVLYFRQKWRRERLDTAFYVAAIICCINFAPTPTYGQYFSVAVPFLIISAVLWLHDGCIGAGRRTPRELAHSAWIVPWVLIGAYLVLAPISIYRLTLSGLDVPRLHGKLDMVTWRISTVRAVSRKIDELAREDAYVVSWWPGYLVETSAKILPGLENNFGRIIAGKLDIDRRRQYGVLTHAELMRRLEQGAYPAVPGRNENPDTVAIRIALQTMGYEVRAQVGGTEIYVKRQRPQ
jgi:4-amino-4-deoxy-L-arabinose transferase-like glycosyltransferase